ncbi:MAG TPA: AAA family ATPase [Chloroflexia bacterium]|nr:AAA family ATPase [Chloroflexia bacterium]
MNYSTGDNDRLDQVGPPETGTNDVSEINGPSGSVATELVDSALPGESAFGRAFSNLDLSHIPAEIKPEARLPYTVTLDNCLLLKVNRHIAGFDGSICSNPVRVMCGAQEHFRANYCDKGESRCYDLSLFSKFGYKVWKPADDEYSEFLQTVLPGSIMFFWTNRANFNYLVGVYVVDKIERKDSRDGMLLGKPHYLISGNPDLSVRFMDGLIDSSPVWNRSVRSETFSKYIRKIDRSYIISALQSIQDKHELRANELRSAGRVTEAEQCDLVVQRLDKVIKLASDAPQPSNGLSRGYNSLYNNNYVPRPVMVPQPPAPKPNKVVTAEVNKVIEHLRREKLYYPEELVWRYHISLMSKPFVILTGVSGGGKTRLTQVYAEAMNGKYCLVSVRPDWQSNDSLLGSYDILNKHFVPSEFCLHVYRASVDYQRDPRTPKKYFVCLDEMNLARAEYYFSDFLSRMEVKGDLRKIRLYDQPKGPDDEVEQDLIIPPNLYITGTVNLDETTHTFSRKVLDRANIIKIDRIEIGHMLDLLRTDYSPELLEFVGTHLKEINLRLAEAGQQFGYRTVREILDWVDEAYRAGYFTMAAALDIQIVQKVLVKLEVSSDHNRQRSMLEKLNTYFEQEARSPESDQPLFEHSHEAILELTSKLEEDDIVIGQL